MYVTIAEYEAYFGVTAPTNFTLLEDVAVSLVKKIAPQRFPLVDEVACLPTNIQTEFNNGLLWTINAFVLDATLISPNPLTGGLGFTIDDYTEAGGQQFNSTQSLRRLSPVAYDKFSNIGLFDQGITCSHPIWDKDWCNNG